jgi:phosphoribosylformylglycinamidine cyclo-ligase
MDYKKAGVDVEKGDFFVEKIKKLVPSTHNQNVIEGIGGFAALYQMSEDRMLAASTDGVGTKLKLAQKLNKHHGIGIDLVAMCVNDLLCVNARPMFFLDYMAFGKLDTEVSCELLEGMVDGCKQSGMALIGGETAEMPGIYQHGDYDVAGFSVGEVLKTEIFSEDKMRDGDVLLGIASSGFHSNGYSLLRQLVKDDEIALQTELLTPTRIYVELMNAIKKETTTAVKGLAHITGGGIQNIPRMSENFNYDITGWPQLEDIAPVFKKITQRLDLPKKELLETFNMGVGLVMLIDQNQISKVESTLAARKEKFWRLGKISKGTGEITL